MSMKTLIPLFLALALAAAACGASEEDPESSPPAVVAGWAEAVEARDFDAATKAVFDPSMVIVLAAENNLPAAETAEMLASGVTPAVAAAYWSSFRDGFDAFAGRPISTLNVGASEELEAGDVRWAFVTVRAQEDASAPVFTRDDGGWLVDLVATLAPGFIEPLAVYLESLPADAGGDAVRQAYVDVVIPALWAAIDAGGHDDDFTRRALALIEAAGA
jgi:ketosteroid isomerase-like protein